MRHFHILLPTALLLSACGGSGGFSLGNDNLPVEPYTLEPLGEFVLPSGPPEYLALTEETIALYESIPRLVVTRLPDSGTASFDGVALIVPFDTPGGYTGEFSGDVNFNTQSFIGAATGFFYDANDDDTVAGVGVPVSGTIVMEDDVFDTGGIAFTATGLLEGGTVEGGGVLLLLGRDGEAVLGAAGLVLDGVEDADLLIIADR